MTPMWSAIIVAFLGSLSAVLVAMFQRLGVIHGVVNSRLTKALEEVGTLTSKVDTLEGTIEKLAASLAAQQPITTRRSDA